MGEVPPKGTDETPSREAPTSSRFPDGGPTGMPTVAQPHQAWALDMQRGAGNAALARALSDPAGATLARAPAPTGTVTSDGQSQPIPGMAIKAKGGPDAETAREQQIARGLDSMMVHARLRMLESRNQLTAATESFRDYASSAIDALDGDPSDYWGLINVATGVVAGVVGVAFPPAAIAAAIAVAIQGAIQTTVTAETKAAGGKAKDEAKAAMRAFATGTRDGFDKGSDAARAQAGPVYQTAWKLSLKDDGARVQFESGQTKDLEDLCDRVGVTNPATQDLFGQALRKLNGAFGSWLGEQKFKADHTRFEQLLGENAPGSAEAKERKKLMGEGETVGTAAAEAAIKARQGAKP